MVFLKKTIILQGFRGANIFQGWGGGGGFFKENYNFTRFQRGQHFPGVRGGGGSQMLISIETHRTCDFSGGGGGGGGVRTPYPPPPLVGCKMVK